MSENTPGRLRIGPGGEAVQLVHYGLHGTWTRVGDRTVQRIVIACVPTGKVHLPCSGEVTAVNCPECKKTAQYMDAANRMRMLDPSWRG